MAAFTEGFSNSGAGEGKLGQHLGKVISMVLEARQLASDERREAQKKLSEQAPGLTLEDFGIDQGYFFKKALQHEFGGAFIDEKKENLKKLLSARKILKSKKKIYVTARNFLKNNTKIASKNAASFRKKFDYNLEVESPAGLEDSSKKVAKAASGGGGGRPKTKQDFLTAVTEIAKSLQSTAQSINNAVDRNTGIASGIVSSQKNIVVEISHRTDTVSDKLEAIAAAVNKQTDFLKRAKEDAKSKSIVSAIKQENDVATTFAFDRTNTKKDEVDDLSTSDQIDIHNERTNNDLGDAEKGVVRRVINGSPLGFKETTPFGDDYVAHGTELEESDAYGNVRITPIANFATDGIQGNEVTPGGDLMAEKGMSIASMPTLPSLTEPQLMKGLGSLNLSKTVNNISSPSGQTGNSQDMVDAMQLPFRAVGASLLKVTGEVRNRLGEVSPAADAKLNNITNVVANAFNLSSQDAITTKAVSEKNARVRSQIAKKPNDGKDDSKWYDGIKNFFGNIIDKTGDMINSIGKAIVDGTKGVWNWLFGKKEDKKQENFSQKEIAEILINEFKKQGLSEEGAQLATAEFMRETSLDQGLVLGSHMDGPNEAWGAGSYQGGREDLLFAHLNEKYGITKENFASSGKEGIQGQASFMLEEIASRGNTELLELLKKPSLNKEEKTRVRQLFKEAYFRYAESIPLDRSEGALKDIHKLLGVETSSSNFQSISTKDAFTATNILEDLNLGADSNQQISFVDLGATAFSNGGNAYTEQLSTGDDTLGIGTEWPLEIASYYPQKLHG